MHFMVAKRQFRSQFSERKVVVCMGERNGTVAAKHPFLSRIRLGYYAALHYMRNSFSHLR